MLAIKVSETPPVLNSDYHRLEDDEFSAEAADALQSLDVSQADLTARNILLKQMSDTVHIELSFKRHLRWAAIDNFAVKMLDGIVISKADVNPHVDGCRDQVKRYMPHGRSVLLQSGWAIRKEATASGFIRTTEKVILTSVNLFVAIALSYRLYQLFQYGSFDASEFQSVFLANSQRGVTSLVRLLATIDKRWLQLLLASPFLIGGLTGLVNSCLTYPLTQEWVVKFQKKVAKQCEPIRDVKESIASYVWHDNLRQLISTPCCPSVSELVEEAECNTCWDGRAFLEGRGAVFKSIEHLALHGRGMSKLNAMRSLATIVHSLAIQDLTVMREARHSKEVLLQILEIKAQALQTLQRLNGENPAGELERSAVSTIYASYLLWWLGMGNLKPAIIFSIFKGVKITAQALFLKEIIQSIIEAINCPDKPGFRMFYGDFQIWANELTLDCFREFVRQFRLLSPNEPFQPFLDQLQNFRLQGLDRLELAGKALTANETQAILQVLSKRMTIKHLDLFDNSIGDGAGQIDFPASLLSLDLTANGIGDKGAKELRLPSGLQSLGLGLNNIGPDGAQGLRQPPSLQFLNLVFNQIGPDGAKGLRPSPILVTLNLGNNGIGDEGAKGLQFPPTLLTLNLENNGIGPDGAKGLQCPTALLTLNLAGNEIGPDGAKGLRLPPALLTVDLRHNGIGDEGAIGLQCPPTVLTLNLENNGIGPDGAKGLQCPPALRSLSLGGNSIGPDGAKGLRLSPALLTLSLEDNGIGDEGAKGLQFPPTLLSLNLENNGIGPEGARGLPFQLVTNLQSLSLVGNGIGPEGASGLQLQQLIKLQSLNLIGNGIGPEGASGLQFPPDLQSLNLGGNGIGPEGAKGLKLPPLQTLYLGGNSIGPDGASGLKLPPTVRILNLGSNSMGPDGAKGLKLPPTVRSLDLENNGIGDEGAKGLHSPPNLELLNLAGNGIGPDGAGGLQLPRTVEGLNLMGNVLGSDGAKRLQLTPSLQALNLANNGIGNEGVEAILQRVSQTNLTSISLFGNNYNTSALDAGRVLQQAALLRRCQDQLCHANTPLQDNAVLPILSQKQSLTAARVAPFVKCINKPFRALAGRVNACATAVINRLDAGYTAVLDRFGAFLSETLSDTPSYFPNLHSITVYDHQPAQHQEISLLDPTLVRDIPLALASGTTYLRA